MKTMKKSRMTKVGTVRNTYLSSHIALVSVLLQLYYKVPLTKHYKPALGKIAFLSKLKEY